MSTASASTTIRRQLEEASGKPVVLSPAPELGAFATISLAGPEQQAHILHYRPAFSADLDYLVAFQCTFGLRSVQSARPFDLSSGLKLEQDIEQLINEHFAARGLENTPEAKQQFAMRLKTGLGQQLRSIPISIRVDKSLLERFPELAPMQRRCIELQLQQQMQTLGPSVREVVPQRIYDASCAMNSAFAKFWAKQWAEPQISLPFVAAGYDQIGESLLTAVNSADSGPDSDRQLVENWATILKIEDWFEVIDRPVSKPAKP